MKIYLAGKIQKNDWRGKLVYGLEDLMPEEWHKTVTLDMDGLSKYVGPFFVACDHGCAHGGNGHGAAGGACSGVAISQDDVRRKSLAGIKACDLLIVRADADFATAYGTIAEIGIAHALRKAVVIVREARLPWSAFHDQWFSFGCADMVIDSRDHVETINDLLRMLAGLKGIGPTVKYLLSIIHNFYKPRLDNADAVQWELDRFKMRELDEREYRERQVDAENLARLQKASEPVLAIPSATTKTNAGPYEIETTVSVAEKPAEDWKN